MYLKPYCAIVLTEAFGSRLTNPYYSFCYKIQINFRYKLFIAETKSNFKTNLNHSKS